MQIKLLTLKQASQATGLAEVTLRTWAADRRISVVRLGRAVRISEAEILRIIERGTIPAREERK